MIQIKDEALRKGAMEGMDEFLQVFIDAYEEAMGGELTAETMPMLNGYQISLLAYYYFRREVNEGGFVQLIYNGYGSFIFENPFAKAMRLMGAKEFSKLVYDARAVYMDNKEELTREKTDEEFMATYEKFETFDKLEEVLSSTYNPHSVTPEMTPSNTSPRWSARNSTCLYLIEARSALAASCSMLDECLHKSSSLSTLTLRPPLRYFSSKRCTNMSG